MPATAVQPPHPFALGGAGPPRDMPDAAVAAVLASANQTAMIASYLIASAPTAPPPAAGPQPRQHHRATMRPLQHTSYTAVYTV